MTAKVVSPPNGRYRFHLNIIKGKGNCYCKSNDIFIHFMPLFTFYTLRLKTSENVWFSDIFRGSGMRPVK